MNANSSEYRAIAIEYLWPGADASYDSLLPATKAEVDKLAVLLCQSNVEAYKLGENKGHAAQFAKDFDELEEDKLYAQIEVLDRLEGEVNRTKPLFFTDEVPQSVEEVMELTVKIREEQRKEIKAIIERQKQELKEEG